MALMEWACPDEGKACLDHLPCVPQIRRPFHPVCHGLEIKCPGGDARCSLPQGVTLQRLMCGQANVLSRIQLLMLQERRAA
ncbi:hypothetical protein AAFF_G00127880 [Aldrovandia affinis]|uniref:Uncharacterized protein n=1 Tax=Aldrovandia affinis TaxID=143900 RepID=A0AAD7WX50_9TELE|nr:hypothetical protein AAFF_G00127880 [Aldrovandia affinis]